MAKKEKTLILVINEQGSDSVLDESVLTNNNKIHLVFPYPVSEVKVSYVPKLKGIVISLTKAERPE